MEDSCAMRDGNVVEVIYHVNKLGDLIVDCITIVDEVWH